MAVEHKLKHAMVAKITGGKFSKQNEKINYSSRRAMTQSYYNGIAHDSSDLLNLL